MRCARFTPNVVDNHIVACRAQVERHAGTHGPQANETHSHMRLLSVLSVGSNLYLFLVAENTVSVPPYGLAPRQSRLQESRRFNHGSIPVERLERVPPLEWLDHFEHIYPMKRV